MVGKIHPFSLNINHLSEEPLHQLIWIVWDSYRGGKRWGDPEKIDYCVVCRYVGEWAIDLIWQKWKQLSNSRICGNFLVCILIKNVLLF